MEEHKKAAADPPASAEKAERDSVSLTSRNKVKVCCREHAGKEVELFCETCGEPVCVKCALKGGKHHSHDCAELDKAFERYKVEVTASLEPMEKQVTTITKALAQLDARCAEISDQRAAVEADVHTTFRKLQRILDTRKTELIGQLHHITQRKLKGLAVQRDQLETTLAQLSSCLGFMRESLKTGSQEEVLLMKSSVVKQVKELTTTFPPDMLKSSTEADAIFSALANVTAACRNYGQVSAPGLPDPSKCHTTDKGIEAAVVGEMFLTAVGAKGERPLQFSYPADITFNAANKKVYDVIEWRNHRVQVLNSDLTFSSSFGKHGSGKGQFDYPHSIACDSTGKVYVADYNNHRVQVFTAEGKFLKMFGRRGDGKGELRRPVGVAIDSNDMVYVSEGANNRVSVFTSEGVFVTSFGSYGVGPGQFKAPYGVAVDNSGVVYVCDFDNNRVQIF